MDLVAVTSLKQFFKSLLDEALGQTGLDVAEVTEFYLANLLAEFAAADRLFAPGETGGAGRGGGARAPALPPSTVGRAGGADPHPPAARRRVALQGWLLRRRAAGERGRPGLHHRHGPSRLRAGGHPGPRR